jgi:hypothetical protein
MTSGVMRFPEDRLATFTCSYGAADRSAFEVIGTKGVLKMDPAYEMVGDLKSEITIGERSKKAIYPKRDQFAPELVYFSDCILKNKRPNPMVVKASPMSESWRLYLNRQEKEKLSR